MRLCRIYMNIFFNIMQIVAVKQFHLESTLELELGGSESGGGEEEDGLEVGSSPASTGKGGRSGGDPSVGSGVSA